MIQLGTFVFQISILLNSYEVRMFHGYEISSLGFLC